MAEEENSTESNKDPSFRLLTSWRVGRSVMARHLAGGDAVLCVLVLAVLYGTMSFVVYNVVHMRHVSPLGADAPDDVFSEARAVEHVRRLTVDIPSRQEGQPGLEEAAQYIEAYLQEVAKRAGPELKIEVEETLASGSFSMWFLNHRVTLAYRNHKNIAMRISSNVSDESNPSFLVNAHYDSPLGSPGAGDCGSCVASLLEVARLIIDSKWVPPQPVILLFNGAEELFLLGSHGFVTTHKWSRTVGAFIDLEASGSGGLDMVVQSGPGSWPSRLYARSAKYPMANSIAQEIFSLIPGDTDYRIFAQDYGNIPGLDIIFVLGGYFYHTSYDTLENLMPGSVQARGENLFGLVKAFTNSSNWGETSDQSNKNINCWTKDGRAVFFDFLTWFMVFYSHELSLAFHSMPAAIFLLVPIALCYKKPSAYSLLRTSLDLFKGIISHAAGILLAVVISVLAAFTRVLLTRNVMNWFAHPYLAFLMFVPTSIIGLLLPMSLEALKKEACFWGAFGFYALVTLAYMLFGLAGGFLTFFISISMLLGWLMLYRSSHDWSRNFLKSLVVYVLPLIPCILYSLYYGGILIQIIIEKMGMMGSLPEPYGHFVPDIIVAAAIGIATGWVVGPVIPVVYHWMARPAILKLLVQVVVFALALSSQYFPYSIDAPKRVVFQHTFLTTDANTIVESSYDFSVVDSNPPAFLFKNAPEATKWITENSELSFGEEHLSDRSSWVALYPVSFLFSGSLKLPARSDEILERYTLFPHLALHKPTAALSNGRRRVYLELHLGSLEEIWVSVLNITGPLSNWSFADGTLSEPQAVAGGPPSYVCRLSGTGPENWTFWLEANSSQTLRIDLAVLDQHLVWSSTKLKGLFPSWADVTAFSTFFSTYHF